MYISTIKEFFCKYNFVTMVALWLLLTMPFAAFKGVIDNVDLGTIILMSFNRFLFIFIGVYSLIDYIFSKNKIDIYITCLFLLISFTTIIGIVNTIFFVGLDFRAIILDCTPFLFFFSILMYLRKFDQLKIIGNFVCVVIIFYSLDLIFQYFFSFNIIGIEPVLGNKNWGFFDMGSPPAGHFLSIFYFFPYFFTNGLKRFLIYLIITAGILVSGDRGPVIQILFSIFLYILIDIKGLKSLTVFVISILCFYFYFQ